MPPGLRSSTPCGQRGLRLASAKTGTLGATDWSQRSSSVIFKRWVVVRNCEPLLWHWNESENILTIYLCTNYLWFNCTKLVSTGSVYTCIYVCMSTHSFMYAWECIYVCFLLFYVIASYIIVVIWCTKWEKSLNLHFYRPKRFLTSHTIKAWYERNWYLMML